MNPTTNAPSQSLAFGRAGLALLHVQQARAGLIDWTVADRTMATVTRDPVDGNPDRCGLFHGVPAVAFVLHTAQRSRYAKALAVLDQHVDTITRSRLRAAHSRIAHGEPPALREYDLISGLTGIGAYLLHRHAGGPLLEDVLSYLVRLTEPLTLDGTRVPGWWTGHGPTDRPSPMWPGGHGNNGIAHGIAGPLALLASAALRGIAVPGHHDAIGRIGDWLDRYRQDDGPQAWWPGLVSLREHQQQAVEHAAPQRPSWCYGTPGLVRAQQLAAIALGDRHRQQLVEQALLRVLDDPVQLARLTDNSLCHGWAGLLHCTSRVAGDVIDKPTFSAMTDHLERLTQEGPHQPEPASKGGLLEGEPGIQLVQTRGQTRWDACLLLAG